MTIHSEGPIFLGHPVYTYLNMDTDAATYVLKVLGKIVDKFAMVSGPTSTAKGMHCPYCKKVFKKIINMRKHVKKTHKAQTPQPVAEGVQTQSRARSRSKATDDHQQERTMLAITYLLYSASSYKMYHNVMYKFMWKQLFPNK